MSEYIDREALLREIMDIRKWMLNRRQDGAEHILTHYGYNVIAEFPAADVRPVVRGEWKQVTQPSGWYNEECAECSVCGEDFVLDEWGMDDFTNLMYFCPNCGADMRKEYEP